MADPEIEKQLTEKADEVAIVVENGINQSNQSMAEKEQADRDLQAANHYLRKAEAAINSIKPSDIRELRGMRNAVDTTRLILDTVQLLFQRPMDPVKPKSLYILKQKIPFVADSYESHTCGTLTRQTFLKDLINFAANEKDNINEETVELLQPYIDLKAPNGEDVFNGAVAKKSSAALEGMCVWAAAMSDYSKYSKIVKSKQIGGRQELSPGQPTDPGHQQETKNSKSKSRSASKKRRNATEVSQPVQKVSQRVNNDPKVPQTLEEMKAVLQRGISKFDFNELKSLKSPPLGVIMVSNALCALMGRKEEWSQAQQLMNNPDMLSQGILHYDVNEMSMQLVQYLQANYTEHPENSQFFDWGQIRKRSAAAADLALWISTLIRYRIALEQQKSPEDREVIQPLSNSFNTPSKRIRPSTVKQNRTSVLPKHSKSMFEQELIDVKPLTPAKYRAMSPIKKSKALHMYGNVSKMTPQQELFAMQMAQKRKDAKKQNKIEFARVRRVNEMYLAEDESRKNMNTHERLYQMGTYKIQNKSGYYPDESF